MSTQRMIATLTPGGQRPGKGGPSGRGPLQPCARAALRVAGDSRAAAPPLGELARDGEAEPGATGHERACAAAVKALEDSVLLARLRPRTVVEHVDAARPGAGAN